VCTDREDLAKKLAPPSQSSLPPIRLKLTPSSTRNSRGIPIPADHNNTAV
jgi:hypothetical protein